MGPWELRRFAFVAIVSVAAVLAGVILGPGAALAADITLVSPDGLKPGMDGRLPINAPGSGYTRVKAESDDPDDVQVENPNVGMGGLGISYTLKGDPGRPVVIRVTWLNPQTGDKQYRFYLFVVKSADYPMQAAYDRLDAVTVSMRGGKASVRLPQDRVPTDVDNNRDFMGVPVGGAGVPGYDRSHPNTVTFAHLGLALYQYSYTLDGKTHYGLYVINVVEPAATPSTGTTGPAQPNKPDDHGGGGD